MSDPLEAPKWFSEDETEADKLKRQIHQKDIERDNLMEQMDLQGTKLLEVQGSLREAMYKLEVEAGKAVKLEATLAQTTKDLRQERIAQANLHQAIEEAAQTQASTDRELKQLQHELDKSTFHSDTQIASLAKDRDALQARVRSLESAAQSRGRPISPLPVVQSQTPKPRRSSSTDTGLQVMRLETELEHARRAQQIAEADAADARSRLSKLNQELIRTQNAAMAAEAQAKKDIRTLDDEVEEQRYAIEGLEQELLGRDREIDELKAHAAQPQVSQPAPEVCLLDFDVSFADDSRPSTSNVRRSAASRARLSVLRPRAAVPNSTFTLDPISAETPTNGSFTLDDLSPSSKMNNTTADQTNATRRSDLRSSRRSSTAAIDQNQIAMILAAVDRLRLERETLRRKLHFLEIEVQLGATPGEVAKDQRMEELGQDLDRLRAELEVAQQVGGTDHRSESQPIHDEEVDDLFARIEGVSSELERRSVAIDDAENESDDFLQQVEDLSRMLQHAEAERDGYQNQITDLQRRVRNLDRDLEDAEDRCAALRQERLANAAGSPGPMKGEIQALEDRVLRRTEQIGTHQHDLKRLEMNLRIAEEDLEETHAELEAHQREKACLIEDSEAARAQRDEAHRRREEAEDRMFELEDQLAVVQREGLKLERLMEELDSARLAEASTLISLIFEGKAQLRWKHQTQAMPSPHSTVSMNPDIDLSADALDLSTTRLNVMSRLHQFTELQQANEGLADCLQEAEERIITLTSEMVELRAQEGRTPQLSIDRNKYNQLLQELEAKTATCGELQRSVDDAMAQLSELQDANDILRESEEQLQIIQLRLQASEAKVSDLVNELHSRALVIRELETSHAMAQDAWEQDRMELEQDVHAMYDTELRRSAELHDSKLAYETLRNAQESVSEGLRNENSALAKKVQALQGELSLQSKYLDEVRTESTRMIEELRKSNEVELRAATESLQELRDKLDQNKSYEAAGTSSPSAMRLAKLESEYEKVLAECKEMEASLQFKAELLEEADDKVYELMREKKQLQKQLQKAGQHRLVTQAMANPNCQAPSSASGSTGRSIDLQIPAPSSTLSANIDGVSSSSTTVRSALNPSANLSIEAVPSVASETKPRLKGLKLPPNVGVLRPTGTRPVLRSIPSQPRLVTQPAAPVKENVQFKENIPVKENVPPVPSPTPAMPTLVFASSTSKKRSREDDLPSAPLRTAAIVMPSTTPLSVRIRRTQGRIVSGGFTPSRSGGVRDMGSRLENHSPKRIKPADSLDLGTRSPMPVLNFTHRDPKGLRTRLETSTGNRPLNR